MTLIHSDIRTCYSYITKFWIRFESDAAIILTSTMAIEKMMISNMTTICTPSLDDRWEGLDGHWGADTINPFTPPSLGPRKADSACLFVCHGNLPAFRLPKQCPWKYCWTFWRKGFDCEDFVNFIHCMQHCTVASLRLEAKTQRANIQSNSVHWFLVCDIRDILQLFL